MLSLVRRLGWRAVALVRRRAFLLRIVSAVAASVLLLVLASNALFTHAISSELVAQDARAVAADGRAIEKAYDEGSDPADALDDALDLVDSMEDRLGFVSAKLLDGKARVVTGVRDSTLQGDRNPNPKLAAALHKGKSFAGAEPESRKDGASFQFIVPVDLGGRRYVLQVDQDGRELDAHVAALRDDTLLFSLLALLLGAGLFYALGGRILAQRHRSVVKRATRDPLTDLGNHRSFQQALALATSSAIQRRESLAVVLVDLDDFKFVNDRFGHRRGDEVLAAVARILADGRPGDSAFRIGGDEFALLLPGADGVQARLGVERRLAAARDDRTASSFSVGVAVLAPGRDEDSTVLWEQADAALYEGKRSGGGGVVLFDDVAELLSVVTPDKVRALRALLEEPRLQTAFQPIWVLEEGRLLGLEALARPAADYGFEGPAEMFAVAEKIGRAHELDSICRADALAHAHELPDGVLLFLNVSPQSLAHDTLGGDRLVRAVRAVGLEPEQVVLEITERSDARRDQVIADATRLRSLGFLLALDDVGAGNAGLEMLRELPLNFVKVDRSVIAAAVDDNQAQAVLVAIVAYARRAGAFVIAEGIESEEILFFVRHAADLDILRDPPIDGGQGFMLGRPSFDVAHPRDREDLHLTAPSRRQR